MNRSKKISFTPHAAGGISLLVIFAVLCFTIFALLSLSTVQADNKISTAMVESISEYYEADCRAQTVLARLRNGELPDGVEREGNIYSFECPVSKTQKLKVKVLLENKSFLIQQWETAASIEWNNNEHMNLWQGTE